VVRMRCRAKSSAGGNSFRNVRVGGRLTTGRLTLSPSPAPTETTTLTAGSSMMWDSNTTVARGEPVPLTDPAKQQSCRDPVAHRGRPHSRRRRPRWISHRTTNSSPPPRRCSRYTSIPALPGIRPMPANPGVYPGTPDYDEIKQGPPCNRVSLFGNAAPKATTAN